MTIFYKMRMFFKWFLGGKAKKEQKLYNSSLERKFDLKPDVFFNSISIVSKTPPNKIVREKEFIVVHNKKPYWALFKCPCGCTNVISLSLQNIHKPHWRVTKTQAGRPSLYPSVWQNKGCCSHFRIEDGRVYWCDNTGIEPWVAEPRYYSKPD